MKFHILLVLLLILNLCMCDDELVQVELKHGKLSGKVERTFLKKQNYYSFKGIPYAEAPVGKLRFKPPLPKHAWKEIYEAFNNKPTCYQYSSRRRAGESFGISGSEDCLYISVFTPNLKGSAPVIVFDYNDNFRTAFNGTDTYSPDFFLEEDVVVVTISHRLGLLGYFTTMDEVIPPNNGVKDFILGLNWIKENINAFGGDPQRVTLMGSRGGAVLADILLHTDKAKGLFNNVILQSGTALEAIFFPQKSREKAFEFGKLFNITTDDSVFLLEELQKLAPEALVDKDGDVIDFDEVEAIQLNTFPFSPVVENDDSDGVITSLPEDTDLVNDVPIMIGMNSREGLDLIAHYIFAPQLLENVTDILFLFPIRSHFKFDPNSTKYNEAMKEIQTHYLREGYFYYANILEYAIYMGDMLQNYALNVAAKTLSAKAESPVYYYKFDVRGGLNENFNYLARYARFSLESWGATIIDELCYLHLCNRIRNDYKELANLLSQPLEIKVLKKMVRLWTNFAKTSNPTPNENDEILKGLRWTPVEKGNDNTNYLHITKNLKMKKNPLGKRGKFWDDFLEKYSKLAVDGVVQENVKQHDEL